MLSEPLNASRGARAPDSAMREAVQWEVRLRAGDVTREERDRFEAWRRADPAHDQAWTRLQQGLARFSPLQAASGAAVRSALSEPSHARRRLLKAGGALSALALAAVGTRELVGRYALDADYHNAGLAPQVVALNDGAPMTLGASARVYATDAAAGHDVYLASGQILTNPVTTSRIPLVVRTRDGSAATASARLSVDALRYHTVVAVQGGEATLATPDGGSLRVDGGSAWSITARRIARMPETAEDIFAWKRGMLVVLDRPVPDIIETLGRYYSGYIRFPQEALSRRVSGVFALNDAEAALRQLASGLGLSLVTYGKVLAVASEA
ncbi:DUF4880 domain-containing protein [Burkholderia glumae]|uniref:DUF4880 domain-containing protein n=2 Tax=Burkholderia glumae TaxID=337 RepID=A0AAQ0BQ53_BURGL|nr:DUF4880 domain-containing protein [Burkholderia glumae]ACR31458.2 Putative transmembrane sensor [Burkholderia glumae BGR1]PJO22732.1 histidine kinase [Burkholderia glumae AU6208]AJY64272.1 fecR family protein [Burkholderia glumae LMG 2196 = ATCC 33617]KHJ60225.1 histidine kinase [Burkholderia glumae]MCM2495791.1 DUF4880 domain-containing protein [Burkholderia glumae]